ncbi:MAG TPA: gamma-glutamyl-gamma-aminobutyrate hydrolase family protein [Blastocatellia bacterium]|nr:gamma-glutamyl-gamma-aminobutyrate hydrolase family protein [Blastocatellia bacterium]
MNVGLLECDHVLERYRHIAGDYREMFAALFSRHAPQLTLRPFNVCNGEFPATVDACDAYLCTGSRHSVYEDVDWINSLKGFVRQAYEAGRPFVGICFGHQMLAEALGGKTAKAPQGWGVGIHDVEIVRSEPWMQPEQTNCRLQYMHQDQVQRLPGRGVLLAESDHCPVAMFRVGDTMLGIQAHPEFLPAYCEALMLDRIERIGAERAAAGLASLGQATDEGVVTSWIARFCNLPAPTR